MINSILSFSRSFASPCCADNREAQLWDRTRSGLGLTGARAHCGPGRTWAWAHQSEGTVHGEHQIRAYSFEGGCLTQVILLPHGACTASFIDKINDFSEPAPGTILFHERETSQKIAHVVPTPGACGGRSKQRSFVGRRGTGEPSTPN